MVCHMTLYCEQPSITFGQASLRSLLSRCYALAPFDMVCCWRQGNANTVLSIAYKLCDFLRKSNYHSLVTTKKKSVGIKLPQCTRPAPFVVYIVGLTFPASYFPIDGLSVCFNWKGRTWIWHKSRFSWPDCSWYFKEAIQPSLPYKHDAVKNQIFWINDCKQDALVLHLKWWRWEVINRNTCTRHNNLYFGMLQDIIRHLIKCQ